ncbi:MAG: SpoIIIAH-like family protein [Oscillospiraceae bacterium]|jgi:stage III sporulation protein AH|nr:SpoIIIAH-like family protein [Oscillospiraceae bacterium]
MKLFRRNAIILTVIVFVCVAVYLNWAYNNGEGIDPLIADTNQPEASDVAADDSGMFYEHSGEGDQIPLSDDTGSDESSNPVQDYFANARLSRQKARDSAVTILRETSESTSASQEVVDESLSAIAAMATYSLSEAEIESLIRAKGFTECVAFLSDDGIIVTVPAPYEGLSSAAVAKITDIVTSETVLGYDQIKIIEVK